MSNEKNADSGTPAVEVPASSYHETAQAFVDQLRRMRDTVPHFTVPTLKGGRKTLVTAASLPPEFMEVTTVARTNNPALVRGEATSPAESRDLLKYADAYGPVADELEAMAQFVRFSIDAAKSKAGYEALTTYALAQRLVRRPEHGNLVPYVADMRRAFGNRGKRPKTGAKSRKQQDAAAATPKPSEEK